MNDLHRIRDIPRKNPEDASVDIWSDYFRKPDAEFKFYPSQVAVFNALLSGVRSSRGAIGNLGLGEGKTLVSLLAGEVVGAKRPLLLIKAPMVAQLEQDIRQWSKLLYFKPPAVVTYSALSSQSQKDILIKLKPDFIVADEAQALKNTNAACTKRFLRYVEEYNPKLLALSATLLSRSIMDMFELCEIALRDWSPFPRVAQLRQGLAAFESPEIAHNESDARIAQNYRDVVGMTFGERLQCIPNVVQSVSISCDADLLYTRTPVPIHGEHKRILDIAQRDWKFPSDRIVTESGNDIADASTWASAVKCLSWGFWYEIVGLTPAYSETRRRYLSLVTSAVRQRSIRGCDTYGLIEKACAEGSFRVPAPLLEAYCDFHEHDETRTNLEKVTHIVSTEPAQFAVERGRMWIAKGHRTILWYRNLALGDMLRSLGVHVFGSGEEIPREGPDLIAASIFAHGTGKNLQHWSANVILQCPSDGQTLDQLIGRTHRRGQTSPEVYLDFLEPSFMYARAFDSACERGRFIARQQGIEQRIGLMQYVRI